MTNPHMLATQRELCYPAGMEKEPLIVVYQALNLINGKCYIGMTTRGLSYRRRRHKHDAKHGANMLFSRAIRKHGFDNFKFSVLEVCADLDEVLRRERELIADRKPEYNVAAGGLRGPQGWKHTPEAIEKMRAARALQPGYWKGKKRPPETTAKAVATRALNPVRYWLGKKRPEMSAICREKWPRLPNDNPTPGMLRARRENMVAANVKRMKAVLCETDGKVHLSIRHAARYYELGRKVILRGCKKECETHGLKFSFVKAQ